MRGATPPRLISTPGVYRRLRLRTDAGQIRTASCYGAYLRPRLQKSETWHLVSSRADFRAYAVNFSLYSGSRCSSTDCGCAYHSENDAQSSYAKSFINSEFLLIRQRLNPLFHATKPSPHITFRERPSGSCRNPPSTARRPRQ